MPSVKIFSDKTSHYSPLLWGESPAYKRYEYIRDILIQYLGPEFSTLLSAPSIQRETSTWYSESLTPNAISLSNADKATEQFFRPKIDHAFQAVATLIAQFESHKDDNIKQLASKLTTALQIPSEDYIYVDPSNGRFCLVAWGFNYNKPGEKKFQEGIKITLQKESLATPAFSEKKERHQENEPDQQQDITPAPKRKKRKKASSTEKADDTAESPTQVLPVASPIDDRKKRRRWLTLLAVLLGVFALIILYLIFFRPSADPYRGVLPEEADVLPPIDTTNIVIDEDDPLRQTIVSNRLNVYLTAQTDIKAFSLAFKEQYPNPDIKIVYYTAAANRLMIECPSDLRLGIKEALQASKNVEFIMDETVFSNQKAAPSFNDPGFADEAKIWHMEAIQLFEAWKITQGDPNVTIAIIDDGFDIKHSEFQGQLIHQWNIPVNSNFPNGGVVNMFHGTHVAAITGAKADNNVGISGIAPGCKIMPVQVGNPFGIMTTSAIVDGLFYAYHHGADVINLSLGSSFTENLSQLPLEEQERLATTLYSEQADFWTQLFKLFHEKGIVVVQASGNSNILTSIDPMQRNPYTIKVTATNTSNQKASFSNFGDVCQLSAPGTAIFSAVPNNRYNTLDGTSMAAPIVSGAVALLKSKYPGITPDDCLKKLYNTGIEVAVNMGRLIQLADALDYINTDNPCDEEIDRLREEVERLKEELNDKRQGLIIPEQPSDFSFMEGIWKSTTDLFSSVEEEPIQLFFRFDKQGNGELTVAEADGEKCKAPLKAKISPLKMDIEQLSSAVCNKGSSHYNPYTTRCVSSPNQAAVCVAVNKTNKSEVKFQLVKVSSF